MSNKYNKKLASNIKSILYEIGEKPSREGLIKTPERVAKSLDFLTNGYKKNPSEILKSAMFSENYSQNFFTIDASQEVSKIQKELINIIKKGQK